MEQFARQHTDALTVVGLGTQDTLDMAREFVATTGPLTFTMLWDETFDSWDGIGVAAQPAAVLYAADGRILGLWQGAIPEDKVLELIA